MNLREHINLFSGNKGETPIFFWGTREHVPPWEVLSTKANSRYEVVTGFLLALKAAVLSNIAGNFYKALIKVLCRFNDKNNIQQLTVYEFLFQVAYCYYFGVIFFR